MADDLKKLADDGARALADVRAELELAKAGKGLFGMLGSLFNRFPAGTSKGGQFAPKGQGGGGGDVGRQHDAAHPGSKAPIPGSVPHPAPGDKGQTIHVNYPSKPSPASTHTDPNATATFVPGQSDLPAELNGVKFTNAKTPDDWSKVTGTNEKLEADMPFAPHPGKSTGAGVIIIEDDGRVWLTKPTNEFGGYKNTFPKGTVEPGLTMQQNAIKEAFEETGLKIKITGVLGDYERTTSKARFYVAKRVGGSPKNMGWESQAVRLAPLKDMKKLLNVSVDHPIVADLEHLLSFGKARFMKAGSWATQARWPQGSPLGGQWKAMGSDGLTLPPTIAGGHAGKNANYQKAVDGAHALAQKGDVSGADMVMGKYIGSLQKWESKQITSSHVKWGAQAYQYADQLKSDMKAKLTATSIADKINGVQKLSSMTPVGAKPGGSNPGGLYDDGTGATYLVKGNKQLLLGNQSLAVSNFRAHNEVLAAKLMLATGVGAPEMKVVDLEGKHGGGLGVASKMVDNVAHFDPNNPQHVAAAQADFAVHAWLGNYDALGMGYDNTVIDKATGKAINIDPGGALLFRAQGAFKDPNNPIEGLKPDAPEFETMRKTTSEQAAIYGKMTLPQLAASAEKLKNISQQQIIDLATTYAGNPALSGNIAARLIARKQAILNKIAMAQSAAAQVPDIPGLPSNNQAAPPPKPQKEVIQENTAQLLKDSSRAVLNQKGKELDKIASGSIHEPDIGASGVYSVAKVKELAQKGDLYGLAEHAATLKMLAATYKTDGAPYEATKMELLATFAATHLVQQQAKLAIQAQKITPPTPAGALTKPVFNSGFENADKFYNEMADKFAALHQAGDLDGLKKAATVGKYDGGAPWKAGTKNGVAAQAYHAALVNDLENKSAALAVTTAKKADEVISEKAPAKQAAPQTNGALPNFDVKLPESNKNWKTHNSKLDVMSALADNGDVKGLLSLSYGTNTYAKKEVKLANAALAALGSPHKVTPGQKKNQHPALTGGVSQQYLNVASVKIGQPLPKQPPASVDLSKLDMSKAPKLDAPNFTGSSKPWVNQQNNELAKQIKDLYESGNLTALQSLTFKAIDKETGKETGEVKHISAAPAKVLGGMYDQAVGNLKDIANPPAPLKHFDGTAAKSIADIDAHFPSKPMGTVVAKQPKNEQMGFWLALGKVGDPQKFVPQNQQNLSPEAITKGYEKYKTASPMVKKFISGMQSGSTAFANAYRNGHDTYNGTSTSEMAKAALDYATEHPPGTKVYRYQSMPYDMVQKVLAAEPGTIMQATGPMPTSYHPTDTQGFGSSRVEIVFAHGAKAVDSFGSGNYSGEYEVTTLPNARFMLLSAKQKGNGAVDMKLLMLPPDIGLGTKPKRKKKA